MSEHAQAAQFPTAEFPEVDFSDERNFLATIGGSEPVVLVPQPDGTIRLIRRGDAPSLDAASFAELTELVGDLEVVDLSEPTFTELAELAQDEPEEDAAADLAAAEDAYQDWRSAAIEQGVDLALAVGDAVEWGEGQGKGHGILMELDTSEGNALVHTAEVIPPMGDSPGGLSPTGKTIKIDAAKLRPSPLKIVGENPVGPERVHERGERVDFSADLDDEEIEAAVMEEWERMHDGFGAHDGS